MAAAQPREGIVALQYGIQLLAIVSRDVLDVSLILETALHLEGYDSGLQDFGQIHRTVHIAQGEEVLVVQERAPSGIHQIEGGTANLGALAAVAATARHHPADVTLAAVTDTQRSVNEGLQLYPALLMDVPNGVQIHFTCQYGPAEPQLFQKPDAFEGIVVTLRAGVETDGRQVHFQQSEILHNDGVGAQLVQLYNQLAGILQFVVIQQRIDGNIEFGAIQMGIAGQLFQIFQPVAGSLTGAETGRTDVQGICPVVDGNLATVQILGRYEQFYLSHSQRIGIV